MNVRRFFRGSLLALLPLALLATSAQAHKLRERGKAVAVADSGLTVTPSRDWNRLSQNVGSKTETWTLDGEQLNDVTFFGGIAAGKPLLRERDKKDDPLPKFTKSTLLIELPELLEGTYRTYKDIAAFQLLSSEPTRFLGSEGVLFTYSYTDVDGLTRKGEAKATISEGALYMITFDAPQLHYYDKVIEDFRALTNSASL